MNKLCGLLMLMGLILGQMLVAGCGPEAARAALPVVLPPNSSADILAATVVIQLIAPYLDENGNRLYAPVEEGAVPLIVIDTGLGTVISSGDVTFIVTHDHWTLIDAPQLEVRILDSAGTILQFLNGDTFRALIRYRDGRVIVLNAPGGLTTTGRAGNGDGVPPGSLVQVVYRDPLSGQLAVVPAVVEAQMDYKDVPSFRLDNLQDQRIEPGNSGGGVWFGGQLVGVISHTILAEVVGPDGVVESKRPSDRSYAARLSPARMPVLNPGQPIASR